MRRRGKTDELYVITKGKDLCRYIFTVTDKAPKKYRFTFISRLQNHGLNVVENLYRANMVYVRGRADQSRIEQRKFYQRKAYVDLKVLCYIAMISMEQKCILPKQYEQISMQAAEVMKLLAAWSRSDQKRYRG